MKIANNNLYFITSQEYSNKRTTLEVAKSTVCSGIDILQLREKTLSKPEILRLGKKLSTLCKKSNILFIVNDDPFIAKELDSDGIHLGQEDLKKFPIKTVRQIIGKNKIIGLSTHSLEQIKQANNQDIDYIGFGPLFKTKTKDYFLGLKHVKKALEISKIPIVFIGGINSSNIEQILELGAKNIALIREITQSSNIEEKTKELKSIISKYKN